MAKNSKDPNEAVPRTASRRRAWLGAAVGAGIVGVIFGGWGVYRGVVALMPETRRHVMYAPDPDVEAERQSRQAMLDQIPQVAPADGRGEVVGGQNRSSGASVGPIRVGSPADKRGSALGPISLGAPSGKVQVSGPVSLAPSALTVGGHAEADPVQFALHPSRFVDPSHMVSKIGLATVETTGGQKDGAGKVLTHYEKACALEKSRAFVMSMCQDLQGRIWVGCEEGAPGDGVTGGVQVWDPGRPPLEAFTEYTTKDGLGDNNGYAVACDLQGRIWVGHLNHGVSVWNGERWQGYEVVGGLSRPGTLDGPLGERVFHIAVCPKLEVETTFEDPLTGKGSGMSGSVWMCTSAGLSIYFPSTDTWSYVTRAEGLPSDQANSLAFGADGRVYVATQCDGVAIADPADGYKAWTQVKGPDELPTAGSGEGLPTNLMNDVLVARDGAVYVATTAGVAWSVDRGVTWRFIRGANWVSKVKGRIGGPPEGWVSDSGQMLLEDYSTALLQEESGSIYVGHRASAGERMVDITRPPVGTTPAAYVTVAVGRENLLVLGTYGNGLSPDLFNGATNAGAGKATELQVVRPLSRMPAGAAPCPVAALEKLGLKSLTYASAEFRAAYLGQDWATQGDWVGRYGRQLGLLCATNSPLNHYVSLEEPYVVKARIGPHADEGDSVRHWLRGLSTNDPRSLWNPFVGGRRQAEWDDHGEAYPVTQEGPDLCVEVKTPPGLHRVSFYFVNVNRGGVRDRQRDYLVELKQSSGSPSSAYEAPTLVRCRVKDFGGGVYQQFLVKGPGSYTAIIHRAGSLNTICSGVMVDKLIGEERVQDRMPRAMLGNLAYEVPARASAGDMNDETPFAVRTAAAAWAALGGDMAGIGSGLAGGHAQAVLVYRCAAAHGAPAPMLDRWRWVLPLWSVGDRQAWNMTMEAAWKGHLMMNPQLAAKLGIQVKEIQ